MAAESENTAAGNIDLAPTKPPIWNDPVYRGIFFQVVVVAAVIGFGIYITNNTIENMAARGISSGFGFLETTAGFGILMSLVDWNEEMTYGWAFVVSILNTLLVSFIGIIFATILGFIIGVARLSANWLISRMAMVYIEIFRNIPLLLQIFFWYFAVLRALPQPRDSVSVMGDFFLNNRGVYVPRPIPEAGFDLVWISFFVGIAATIAISRWARKRQEATGQQFPTIWAGLALIIGLPIAVSAIMGFPLSFESPELKGFNFKGGLNLIPELVSLVLALSIYTASFIAEIVRAGIQAVSHGQTEAARSLGLRNSWTLRLVVIPQALRVIIPPLTSQYLNLTKNSSLAAAIAYPDLVLVFAGTVLMQTGQAVEVIAMTMAVYLTISLVISMFMNWYNKRIALVER
ncbi:MAG: amino acid ABC transporter permease [Alphaproteobacteria bacterium]|nr:amino acid ABC transporter permease [Alphaproteobacteria bacterium]